MINRKLETIKLIPPYLKENKNNISPIKDNARADIDKTDISKSVKFLMYKVIDSIKNIEARMILLITLFLKLLPTSDLK
jgi:hypothetical protein